MAVFGQVIDDKYEILKLIGEGGMSKVYLAMDKRLNKSWAVKEIEKKAKDRNNEIVVQSAIAEANMIKQLDNPAIVRIVDIIDNGNVIYIIEDFVEGETLEALLEADGAQPEELVVEWGKQLCEAFDYLHTRTPPIIYRDMKPANVMLTPEGKLRVIDFGIAREYKEHNLKDTTSLGTRGYAPPEQFGGKTDARSDIYSLGVTLFQLVTGRDPCLASTELKPVRQIDPKLSEGIETIIQKCVQHDPANRYQSCVELLYDLEHIGEIGAGYRKQQKKKLKTFLTFAIATVLCLIVGITGTVMRGRTNRLDYEQNIQWARNASSSQERIGFYATAIDISPGSMEAYLGMIDAMKEDACYTVQEEETLKNKINTNMTLLKAQPDYARLSYEVGKLYWYYYDYGRTPDADNQITRIKSAIQWFEDAVSYGTEEDSFRFLASNYADIGRFNRDITLNVAEASDKGTYAPYWDSISAQIEHMDEDESEMIKLEVYKLAVYSIETYARKFKSDGIEQYAMTQLLGTVEEAVKALETSSDTTEQIKTSVVSRFKAAEEAIANAFREQVSQ
ncbi:MAG: serine/threonine-protein kinase [Candidatus Faecousia sp.]|nr:serine/threonine protein kinase [Clostridiales bacterium]MDY6180018.1 serine/threonine-protein kinase [Candidatus Faecousia sp.]